MKTKTLKAACLAVGLATAWGGQGTASGAGPDQIQLTVTPDKNLSHVFFFYTANSTGPNFDTLTALPNLAADVSTTNTFFANAAGQELGQSINPFGFYGVIGLYDETNKLISVSLNSSEAGNVIGTRDFATEFPSFTESDVATALLSNNTFAISQFFWFAEVLLSTPVDIPTASSGQMVDFSVGSDGGSLIAQVIPEPAPVLLASVASLAILAFHRRRLRKTSFEPNGRKSPHES